MFQFSAVAFYVVQRVLKRNLFVRFRTVERRNNLLHGFKIKKVKRVGKRVQKLVYKSIIDISSSVIKRKIDLPRLQKIKRGALLQIFKRHDTVFIKLPFFIATINFKNVMFG